MAEKLNSKEVVTFEELLMSNTIEQEALVNLLDRKGIISKAELLEEMKRVRVQQGYKIADQPGQKEQELLADLEQDEDDF